MEDEQRGREEDEEEEGREEDIAPRAIDRCTPPRWWGSRLHRVWAPKQTKSLLFNQIYRMGWDSYGILAGRLWNILVWWVESRDYGQKVVARPSLIFGEKK